MRLKLWGAAVLFAAMFGSSQLDAATLTVCASGCTYTQATLQTAINAAVDGDVITLKAGETFTGHWTLPNKGSLPTGITIRSDTSNANLPAAGVRINPTYNAFLPSVKSDSTSDPAFRTSDGADGYTLMGIRFLSTDLGFNEIIRFGSNVCTGAGACQEFETQEPTDMTVDRCVFDINPMTGQKIGITIGGKRINITNNYLAGFAAIGQDSAAINGSNGHGPVKIENNFIEASTENFMFGGDDARMRVVMTVTGTPTTSSASVTVAAGPFGAVHNLSELVLNSHIAIMTQGGTQRRHTTLRSVTGSGTTGSITFDPIPEVPDTPGDIRWMVQFNDVTIKRNHLTKRLDWLDPITDKPANATATASTASGSLAAGTYTYTVVAYNDSSYTGADAFSGSTVTNSAVLGATGNVTVAWTAVPDATHYRVYGRTGTVSMYWTVTAPTLTYVDTGTAGTAATSVVKGSYWQIKTLGELKAASNVVMSGNVFEYGWAGSDIGYTGLWIKTVNQGNGGEGLQTKNIVIENNIFRHVDGWMLLSGSEFYTGNAVDTPGPITNLTARNNLITDCSSAWALAKGGTITAAYGLIISNHTVNVTIDHNTINCTSRGFMWLDGAKHDNLVITNNMGLKSTNGLSGNGFGQGTTALVGRTNSYTMTANALAGIATGSYPAGNFGPTVTDWQNQFNNYTATGADDADGPADYSLADTSIYLTSGTDGLPLGADMAAIFAATNGVVEGAGGSTPVPPTITTTSPLAAGTVRTAYSTTIEGIGTGPLTYTLQAGTLPTGLSLATSGVLSGTPSVAQTQTFTVRVTDATTSLTDDQVLALTINPSYTAPTITTTTLTGATLSVPYTATLVNTAGLAPFTWSVSAGTLPAGLTLDAATGVLAGTPSALGVASFTVMVTDSLSGSDTQALSLTVAQGTLPCGRPVRFQQQEAFIFRRPAPPSVLSPDCAAMNDIWINTSVSPAVVNLVTSTAGGVVSTTPVAGGSTSTHALLSATHTDTVADTVVEGGIIVGTETGKWQLLAPGPAGSYLGSDGTSVGYQTPASSQPRGTTLTFHTRTGTAATAWTNMPAVRSEFPGTTAPSTTNRLPFMITGYTKTQLFVRCQLAGATGSRVWMEYSLDGTTWTPIDGVGGTGTAITINAVANFISPAVTIQPGLSGFVYLRIAGDGGDGAVDPTFGNIAAVFW